MPEKNIYVSYVNNNYNFFTDISENFPLIPENVLFNHNSYKFHYINNSSIEPFYLSDLLIHNLQLLILALIQVILT